MEAIKILVFAAAPIIVLLCVLGIRYEIKYGADNAGEGQNGI